MIELLFSTKKYHPFAKAIRWRHNSRWSHVDIVMPNRQMVFGAVFPRVSRRPLADVMAAATSYEFAYVDGLTPAQEAAFWRFALEQEGKWYDLRGVAGLGLDVRNWQAEDAWFCSELVAAAFQKAGAPLVRKAARLVPPEGLYMSVVLKYAAELGLGEWKGEAA